MAQKFINIPAGTRVDIKTYGVELVLAAGCTGCKKKKKNGQKVKKRNEDRFKKEIEMDYL